MLLLLLLQAACTPKELKELLNFPNVATHAPADQMVVSSADEALMKTSRIKRRVHEVVTKAAAATATSGAGSQPGMKHLHFHFYRSPVEIQCGECGAVRGLKVDKTVLQAPLDTGAPAKAVGTGAYETLDVQLVLESIGYKSLPLEGLPFDRVRGVVPSQAGRVAVAAADGGSSNSFEPGLYVSGWLKRGPSGIIGTNLVDAEETVESLTSDVKTGTLPRLKGPQLGATRLQQLLEERRVTFVGWGGWKKIDEAEVQAGKQGGRVREKLVNIDTMLATAHRQ